MLKSKMNQWRWPNRGGELNRLFCMTHKTDWTGALECRTINSFSVVPFMSLSSLKRHIFVPSSCVTSLSCPFDLMSFSPVSHWAHRESWIVLLPKKTPKKRGKSLDRITQQIEQIFKPIHCQPIGQTVDLWLLWPSMVMNEVSKFTILFFFFCCGCYPDRPDAISIWHLGCCSFFKHIFLWPKACLLTLRQCCKIGRQQTVFF